MSVPQDVVFDYTLVERASTSAVGAQRPKSTSAKQRGEAAHGRIHDMGD
jgi:hypothetical protein